MKLKIFYIFFLFAFTKFAEEMPLKLRMFGEYIREHHALSAIRKDNLPYSYVTSLWVESDFFWQLSTSATSNLYQPIGLILADKENYIEQKLIIVNLFPNEDGVRLLAKKIILSQETELVLESIREAYDNKPNDNNFINSRFQFGSSAQNLTEEEKSEILKYINIMSKIRKHRNIGDQIVLHIDKSGTGWLTFLPYDPDIKSEIISNFEGGETLNLLKDILENLKPSDSPKMMFEFNTDLIHRIISTFTTPERCFSVKDMPESMLKNIL